LQNVSGGKETCQHPEVARQLAEVAAAALRAAEAAALHHRLQAAALDPLHRVREVVRQVATAEIVTIKETTMEDQNTNTPLPQSTPTARTSLRGFASMDPVKQRAIASKGGQAAHQSGRAHEFDSREAAEAGRKGGFIVSQNREHMARIGAQGGRARALAHKNLV
jgi:uncharacterized protein